MSEIDAIGTFALLSQAARELSKENGRLRAELTTLKAQVREYLDALDKSNHSNTFGELQEAACVLHRKTNELRKAVE